MSEKPRISEMAEDVQVSKVSAVQEVRRQRTDFGLMAKSIPPVGLHGESYCGKDRETTMVSEQTHRATY
jgi:hypothetical protein